MGALDAEGLGLGRRELLVAQDALVVEVGQVLELGHLRVDGRSRRCRGSGRGRVGLLLQGRVLGLEIGQLLVLVVLVGRILGGGLPGVVGGRADRRYTDKPDTASSSIMVRFPFCRFW